MTVVATILNPEVEVWDTTPNKAGQAFQPAGSPDFPVRPWGDWKVAPTGRQECLPHASSQGKAGGSSLGSRDELIVKTMQPNGPRELGVRIAHERTE
jgi:hypothetical protein